MQIFKSGGGSKEGKMMTRFGNEKIAAEQGRKRLFLREKCFGFSSIMKDEIRLVSLQQRKYDRKKTEYRNEKM